MEANQPRVARILEGWSRRPIPRMLLNSPTPVDAGRRTTTVSVVWESDVIDPDSTSARCYNGPACERDVMDESSGDRADSEVVERLREGMERRRSQLAGQSPTLGSAGIHELESSQFLEEPPAVSARPVVGGLIVGSRKLFRHLFLKWYTVPLLRQQNTFNRNATLSFRDVVERNRRLQQDLEELRRRLEALERDHE